MDPDINKLIKAMPIEQRKKLNQSINEISGDEGWHEIHGIDYRNATDTQIIKALLDDGCEVRYSIHK